MASPSFESWTGTGEGATASATLAADLPATINAGDVLIVIVAGEFDSTATSAVDSTSDSWTNFIDEQFGPGGGFLGGWSKTADGDEDSGTVTITTGGTNSHLAAGVIRLSNADESTLSHTYTGIDSGTAPDPPSHTGTAGDKIFIAFGHLSDDAETITSFSSGYINGNNQVGGTTANNQATAFACTKESSALTDDPGVMVCASAQIMAATMSVNAPVTSVPGIQVFRTIPSA